MEYDFHSNMAAEVALAGIAIGSNTTTIGLTIDTVGFEGLEFNVLSKTIADGSFSFLLEEGDLANMSDAVPVPAENIIGSLVGFVAADDDLVKSFGSIGKKRYQRLSIVSIGVSTGVDIMSAVAVKTHPKNKPASV